MRTKRVIGILLVAILGTTAIVLRMSPIILIVIPFAVGLVFGSSYNGRPVTFEVESKLGEGPKS